jgi:hypothetical protein
MQHVRDGLDYEVRGQHREMATAAGGGSRSDEDGGSHPMQLRCSLLRLSGYGGHAIQLPVRRSLRRRRKLQGSKRGERLWKGPAVSSMLYPTCPQCYAHSRRAEPRLTLLASIARRRPIRCSGTMGPETAAPRHPTELCRKGSQSRAEWETNRQRSRQRQEKPEFW